MASVLDGKVDCGWSLPGAESGRPQKAVCLGTIATVCLKRGLEMCVWWVRSHTPSRSWRAEAEKGFYSLCQSCVCTGFCRLT